jgi:hypothetical protein
MAEALRPIAIEKNSYANQRNAQDARMTMSLDVFIESSPHLKP